MHPSLGSSHPFPFPLIHFHRPSGIIQLNPSSPPHTPRVHPILFPPSSLPSCSLPLLPPLFSPFLPPPSLLFFSFHSPPTQIPQLKNDITLTIFPFPFHFTNNLPKPQLPLRHLHRTLPLRQQLMHQRRLIQPAIRPTGLGNVRNGAHG